MASLAFHLFHPWLSAAGTILDVTTGRRETRNGTRGGPDLRYWGGLSKLITVPWHNKITNTLNSGYNVCAIRHALLQ